MDLGRLLEMADDNPEQMRELADVYLAQADELMAGLNSALQAGSVAGVERLAHKLGGSSSTCGMTAIVGPLHELEELARAGRLPDDRRLFDEAGRQLLRIRGFLAIHSKGL